MTAFLVLYLQGDGVKSEVPHISDGIIQCLLNAPQLRGVLLQKLAVFLQLNLCVYFCWLKVCTREFGCTDRWLRVKFTQELKYYNE